MIIVADTSAVVALLDADDQHHTALRSLWESDPDAWVLPWAILPEIDHLIRTHMDSRTATLFLDDVCNGAFAVDFGAREDLVRAAELNRRHAALGVGLVDGLVVATAQRLGAGAVATLDVRHFSAMGMPVIPANSERVG